VIFHCRDTTDMSLHLRDIEDQHMMNMEEALMGWQSSWWWQFSPLHHGLAEGFCVVKAKCTSSYPDLQGRGNMVQNATMKSDHSCSAWHTWRLIIFIHLNRLQISNLGMASSQQAVDTELMLM
jgi:hypothetical protein